MELYTIGHSTREIDDFIGLLKKNQIEVLADVRSFPGSKKFPQYNQEALAKTLAEHDIRYEHFRDLGGRRKSSKNSPNTAWRNKAFQAYADYMLTSDFKNALSNLEDLAKEHTTAIMCSEAVWWRCHRRLISDTLVIKTWNVIHILSPTKNDAHKLNEAAKWSQGDLFYVEEENGSISD